MRSFGNMLVTVALIGIKIQYIDIIEETLPPNPTVNSTIKKINKWMRIIHDFKNNCLMQALIEYFPVNIS